MRRLPLAVLLVLAAAASADDQRVDASCNAQQIATCWDYVGYDPGSLDLSRKGCAQVQKGGGTWAEHASCPTGKRVGRCTRKMFGATTVMSYYPPMTRQQAEDTCKSGGMTFTAN